MRYTRRATRRRDKVLPNPIRLDDAVLETKEAWARLLRGQRNIGDFTRWKKPDAHGKAFERRPINPPPRNPGLWQAGLIPSRASPQGWLIRGGAARRGRQSAC